MDKIKTKLYNMSLKKSLTIIFICFIIFTAFFTSITILIATSIQTYVLNRRTLTFTVGENLDTAQNLFKIGEQYNFSPLNTNQQIIYYGSIILMIILILLYIVIGAYIAGNIYYKIKIKKPLKLLEKGIDNIKNGNLDFSLDYKSDDEFGKLCYALNKMNDELIKDKKKIWKMIEDKRIVNASISHDIGTPTTVIKGYLDYLLKNIPLKKIETDKLLQTLNLMYNSITRIEKYIDSVRDVQNIEQIKIIKTEQNADRLFLDIENEFKKLSDKYGKKLKITNLNHKNKILIDKIQFMRVLENIVNNALRYAKTKVMINILWCDEFLTVIIEDDGEGFLEKDIKNATNLFYTTSKSNNNMGIGLYISKVLCEKQDGKLYIQNGLIGAKITIKIKC